MRKQAKALLLQGAFIPAIPLVLDGARRFDEGGQRRLIRYYLESGADGIAVGVHTTQFAIRDPGVGLFERVLQAAAEELEIWRKRTGKTAIAIAGACGPAAQAEREAALAAHLGYDAVLLSPGGLDGLSEEALLERTRRAAGQADVIGFYMQPAVGGRALSYDYWRAMCEIQGVVAVKCAAFNRYLTADVARAIAFSGRDIALYTGNDDNIVVDLLTEYRFNDRGRVRAVRTAGGLLGHWAFWTHTSAARFHRLKELDPRAPVAPAWMTFAAQTTDANGAVFDAAHHFQGCIAGIHEVLRRQGLLKGIWCLDPRETLSPGQAAEIDRVYAMYPELNDDAFVAEFLQKEEG